MAHPVEPSAVNATKAWLLQLLLCQDGGVVLNSRLVAGLGAAAVQALHNCISKDPLRVLRCGGSCPFYPEDLFVVFSVSAAGRVVVHLLWNYPDDGLVLLPQAMASRMDMASIELRFKAMGRNVSVAQLQGWLQAQFAYHNSQ